jgi:hypothetical protein
LGGIIVGEKNAAYLARVWIKKPVRCITNLCKLLIIQFILRSSVFSILVHVDTIFPIEDVNEGRSRSDPGPTPRSGPVIPRTWTYESRAGPLAGWPGHSDLLCRSGPDPGPGGPGPNPGRSSYRLDGQACRRTLSEVK